MTRAEAIVLLRISLTNENLVKHCIACEAIMEDLAVRLGGEKDLWALAGLLHDIDYEETRDQPEKHGLLGAMRLTELGFPEEVVATVRAHNDATGFQAITRMEKALYAVDPISGFIVACALVHPERRLLPLDLPFLLNRFKEKSFARGANREQIHTCSTLNLTLEDFLALSLCALKNRAKELEL
ncbi:MAG: HDIG domain-containing protein [Candidatus Atribacteria bacterium]|nr:HDIG domain-containing protein [Candidatus Atribacteria bacterium]